MPPFPLPSSPGNPFARVLNEGVKGQLDSWKAGRCQAPGLPAWLCCWHWVFSSTAIFLSLTQLFLFVLILSPSLKPTGPIRVTEKGWSFGVSKRGKGKATPCRFLCCAQGRRGVLRSNSPSVPTLHRVPSFAVLIITDSWINDTPPHDSGLSGHDTTGGIYRGNHQASPLFLTPSVAWKLLVSNFGIFHQPLGKGFHFSTLVPKSSLFQVPKSIL